MDVGRLVRALLRRWLILLIGLIVSVAAAAAVYFQTPSMYQSTSQAMVLLPRTASSPDEATSPFLYMPDGLTTLARVVVLIPNTPEFRRTLAEDGFGAQYEVSVESTAPIVRFSVEGADPQVVLATRDELMRRFAAELKRVQTEEQVPQRQFAHMRYLEASAEVDPLGGDRLRGAAVTAVLGGLLTLAVIILLERRSSKAPAEDVEPMDDGDGTEPDFSAWGFDDENSAATDSAPAEREHSIVEPADDSDADPPNPEGVSVREWDAADEHGEAVEADAPRAERDKELDAAHQAS